MAGEAGNGIVDPRADLHRAGQCDGGDVGQDLLSDAGGWGGHTSVCRAQKTGPVGAAPGGVVDGWGIAGRRSRGHYEVRLGLSISSGLIGVLSHALNSRSSSARSQAEPMLNESSVSGGRWARVF